MGINYMGINYMAFVQLQLTYIIRKFRHNLFLYLFAQNILHSTSKQTSLASNTKQQTSF